MAFRRGCEIWIVSGVWPKRNTKVKKGYLRIALKQPLMETGSFHEHANHMVLGIMCGFVLCVLCVQDCIQGRKRRWVFCSSWLRLWACKLIYVGFCSSWRLMGMWLQLALWIMEGWGVVHIWRRTVLQGVGLVGEV